MALTSDILDQARNGLAPGKALTFSFDDGQFQVRFQFTGRPGLNEQDPEFEGRAPAITRRYTDASRHWEKPGA